MIAFCRPNPANALEGLLKLLSVSLLTKTNGILSGLTDRGLIKGQLRNHSMVRRELATSNDRKQLSPRICRAREGSNISGPVVLLSPERAARLLLWFYTSEHTLYHDTDGQQGGSKKE